MEQETYYELNKGVLVNRICGLDLIISTCRKRKKGSYLILNDDSLFIVNHIQAGETLEAITQAVMKDYETDYGQAKATIENFLKIFVDYGFIRELIQS